MPGLSHVGAGQTIMSAGIAALQHAGECAGKNDPSSSHRGEQLRGQTLKNDCGKRLLVGVVVNALLKRGGGVPKGNHGDSDVERMTAAETRLFRWGNQRIEETEYGYALNKVTLWPLELVQAIAELDERFVLRKGYFVQHVTSL